VNRYVISLWVCMSMVAAGGAALAQIARTKAPEGAKVYIISPKDGAQVSSPVLVQFGLKGIGVAPAGLELPDAATGHHHLLIDVEPGDPALPIPNDKNHLHFGKGQTEAQVELPAGKHTLQLELADKVHVPHDPPILSEKITITVK
jgi:hypothetical protein